MSETLPMSPDLLKKGTERARARTEIFAGQTPKGDEPVLSVDTEAVVTPVVSVEASTAAATAVTDAIDNKLAKSKIKGTRRRITKGEGAAESEDEKDIKEKLLVCKEEWLKRIAEMTSVEDFLQGKTENQIFDHFTGTLQESLGKILDSEQDIRKKIKLRESVYNPSVTEIETAYYEKKFVLENDSKKNNESDAERRAMAELVEYKDGLIKKINACQSLEELKSSFPAHMTREAVRSDLLAKMLKDHPLSEEQKSHIRHESRQLRKEIYEAYYKKEKELKEIAEAKKVAVELEPTVPVANKDAPKPADSGAWTKKRLLGEISDGETFSVKEANGTVKTFRRDGDRFMTTTKRAKNASKAVLQILIHGGKLAKEGDSDPVPVATIDPLVADTGAEKAEKLNIKSFAEDKLVELKDYRMNLINQARSVEELGNSFVGLPVLNEPSILDDIFIKFSDITDEEKSAVYGEANSLQEEIDRAFGEKKRELSEAEKPVGLTEIEKKIEMLNGEILRLRDEVAVARAEYVKEDHKTTSLMNKLRTILGRVEDVERHTYQEYQNKLTLLKEKELERLKLLGQGGSELKKEMEGLSRYFKLDESVSLIKERTQHKAENQSFPEKIVNSLGDLGQWYNRLSWKQKLVLIGATTGAAVLTGGIAGGTVASAILCGKRVLSGSSTFVVAEALLEKIGASRRTSRAEKEIMKDMETIDNESYGFNLPNEKGSDDSERSSFDVLNTLLDKNIASLDAKLQKEKKAKIWRKVGSAGFGALVGSGWLTQFAMDHVKDIFGGSHHISMPIAPGQSPSAPAVIPEKIPDAVLPSMTDAVDRVRPIVPVMEDQNFAGATPPVEPGVGVDGPSASVEKLNEIANVATINDFVDGDIVVQKGDSVWKIAGGLADKLGLEDAQRTHFIDALKDKFGDVRLKAGETINFSEHGIDEDFIKNALGQATELTEGQMASIEANDAKIAEFASSHPDVTLTNESVDTILHGDTADVVSPPPTAISGSGSDFIQPSVEATSPVPGGNTLPYDAVADGGTGEDSVVTAGVEKEGGMMSADINYTRDIVFGKTYDLTKYREYFVQYPDAFPQFQKIDGDYKKFIFSGNSNAFQDVKGKMVSALGDLKEKPLGQFIEMSQKTYGVKLGVPGAKEKVYEYLTRIAMLGLEHPKGTIRLPLLA